jgi:U3 small nucleolar RNA-associated protein 3
MAKKRRASAQSNRNPQTRSIKQTSPKLGPINTYEDVADSEDEFHINRDKILLEDEPHVKRQKKWREEGM